MTSLLSQIRLNARWPLRRARAIRREIEDLTARIAVAEMAWHRDRTTIPGDQIYELVSDLVTQNVFPGTKTLDETMRWYEEHGFASGRPPKVGGWWARRRALFSRKG